MKLLRLLPRFRKAYRKLDTLAKRERWSRAQIEQLQLDRINAVWREATCFVPYYRGIAAELALPPRFTSLEEFTSLVPVLPKALVRSQPNLFLSSQPARGSWHRTGGSTGTPMGVYWEKQAHLNSLRAKYRMEATYGLDIFDRKVFLWGHSGSFAPGLTGRIAKLRQPLEDALRNRQRLSAYRMGRDDLQKYLQQISKFRPASLYGYSTAMYLLAQEAADSGFECDSLKVAIVSGEPAIPHFVDTIAKSLGVPAAIEYGAVECGFIAGQGPDGMLRVREDQTLVETLPREDGLFDLVVTVLTNPSFPLLRYAIDDVTDAPLRARPVGFAILGNVDGRRNDLVVSRTGRLVHSQGVKHVFEHYSCVRRFRAEQDLTGAVNVLVEITGHDAAWSESAAARRLAELLEGYPVTVKTVDVIPGTCAGKHRWIVSELADRHLAGGSRYRTTQPRD